MTTKVQEKPQSKKVNVVKTQKKPQKQAEPKSISIDNPTKFYEDNWYVPVKGFMDKDWSAYLYQTLLMKVQRGEYITDQQSPDQPAFPADSMLACILLTQQRKVEEIVGAALYPTYSYARVYSPGAVLEQHKDRPACEVSITLTLGFEGEPSPLFVVKDKLGEKEELPAGEYDEEYIRTERWGGKPSKIVLTEAGDALAYQACKLIHWREEQPSSRLAQVFLHYVRRDGKNTAHKYDGKDPSAFLKGPLD